MSKWHRRFLSLAEEVASWSKDPACKVGAAVVSCSKREFAFGYNGFPAGIRDTVQRLGDRVEKNELMVHAEVNAILNARRNLAGWAMYCTKPPCIGCALAIIQAGLAALYCAAPTPISSWYEDNKTALTLLTEANVNVYIDRDGVFVAY